jgi:hypothetical protein
MREMHHDLNTTIENGTDWSEGEGAGDEEVDSERRWGRWKEREGLKI